MFSPSIYFSSFVILDILNKLWKSMYNNNDNLVSDRKFLLSLFYWWWFYIYIIQYRIRTKLYVWIKRISYFKMIFWKISRILQRNYFLKIMKVVMSRSYHSMLHTFLPGKVWSFEKHFYAPLTSRSPVRVIK